MSDMQVANRMEEASSGMHQAAEKIYLAARLNCEVEMMRAANSTRLSRGHTEAYCEQDFAKLLEEYDDRMSKL